MNHIFVSFNDIAIVSAKGIDYRTHFWNIREDDSMNIINYSNLNGKRGVLYFFITYKKRVNAIPLSANQLKKIIIKKKKMRY